MISIKPCDQPFFFSLGTGVHDAAQFRLRRRPPETKRGLRAKHGVQPLAPQVARRV